MNRQERLQHGQELSDDFLAHYGVLGMKWGKRKGASVKSSKKSKSGTSYKDAYKEALKNQYRNPIMFERAARKQLRKNPVKHLIGGKAQMVEMNKDVAKQRAAKATYKQGKKATKDAWKKDFGRIVDETQKIQQKAKKGKYTPEIDKKIGDDMAKKFAKAAEAKRNSKVKNKAAYKQSKKLTHGQVIADDFLAHFGDLKSKGGVSHDNNDTLAHYGVLGMKWGKRKGSSGSSIKSSKKSKKNPKASTLSDSELRQRINRLQMEKQYKQLTTKERSTSSKFVGDVVRESAKQTASSYVTKYMKSGVEAGIKRAKKKKTS